MSAKTMLAAVLVIAAAVLAAGFLPATTATRDQPAPAAAPQAPADVIFRNGDVFTMDPRRPWARGVAVRGSQIAAVFEKGTISFEAGGEEVRLVCFRGVATVTVDGRAFTLGRYDAMYIPRDSRVVVKTATEVDLAELRVPVEHRYPLRHVTYAEVTADPGLHFKTGGPSSSRTLNMLLAKNVEAGRLMAGVTWSEPGNWTSWPPHEHADLAEELYVYYDMPPEAFGIQLVYTDKLEPERIEMVRDGDVVIMPRGFHPNVAIPGHPISVLWVMAADREREDRKFGVVNVHPDFAQAPSGLEEGR